MTTIIFLCKIQFLKIAVFTYKIYLERMAGCWTAIFAEGASSLWGGIVAALPYLLLLLSLSNRIQLRFAHASSPRAQTTSYVNAQQTTAHTHYHTQKIIFCMSSLNALKGDCKLICMSIISNLLDIRI